MPEGTEIEQAGKPIEGEPKPITMTPQQLAERLARAKPTDYDDLKTKAARLDELELANKSEVDKAKDAAAKAAAEVATVPAKVADALRTHLIGLHEISTEDAELFLTATNPELLIKQAERLVANHADRKTHGNRVPREGQISKPVDDDRRDFLRQLTGRD